MSPWCKGSVWGSGFKPVTDAALYITWAVEISMQMYIIITVFYKYRAYLATVGRCG